MLALLCIILIVACCPVVGCYTYNSLCTRIIIKQTKFLGNSEEGVINQGSVTQQRTPPTIIRNQLLTLLNGIIRKERERIRLNITPQIISERE